jgi:hypothetical protein
MEDCGMSQESHNSVHTPPGQRAQSNSKLEVIQRSNSLPKPPIIIWDFPVNTIAAPTALQLPVANAAQHSQQSDAHLSIGSGAAAQDGKLQTTFAMKPRSHRKCQAWCVAYWFLIP